MSLASRSARKAPDAWPRSSWVTQVRSISAHRLAQIPEPGLGAEVAPVVLQHGQRGAVPGQGLAGRPHDLLEHAARGPARGHRGPVVGQHVVDEARQDLVADRLLGVEVVVQAAGQDPGGVRDLAYGGRAVALLREQLARELHHIGAPARSAPGATLMCRAHAVIIAARRPGHRGRRSARRCPPPSARSPASAYRCADLALIPRVAGGQTAHGVRRGAAERQAEVTVDRFGRAYRVGHEILVADVEEPRRVVPGPFGGEVLKAAAPTAPAGPGR